MSTTIALAAEDHGAHVTLGGANMNGHMVVQRVTVLETFPTDTALMNQFPFIPGRAPQGTWLHWDRRCLATVHP